MGRGRRMRNEEDGGANTASKVDRSRATGKRSKQVQQGNSYNRCQGIDALFLLSRVSTALFSSEPKKAWCIVLSSDWTELFFIRRCDVFFVVSAGEVGKRFFPRSVRPSVHAIRALSLSATVRTRKHK